MFAQLLTVPAFSLLSLAAAAPLQDSWLQPRDSSVSRMFKRAAPDPTADNYTDYYPDYATTPNTTQIPQAWLDRLNSLTMPNVSVATSTSGNPTYPNDEDSSDSTICSFTEQCVVDSDLYNPSGEKILALSFDDGPNDVSSGLYDFLNENNISAAATHFMIGGNVVGDPETVLKAIEYGGHLAVHTWTHPYMTTLTNEEVVGELGWTMQILSDLNGGRVPKFWRPPYGDVDNRVRAIASGVFDLETVLWNEDTNDWAIADEPDEYSISSVEAYYDTLVLGNRTKSLLLLEHELDSNTVTVFETEYPKALANGWTFMNVADAWGLDWYLNSADDNATVTTMSVAGTLTTAQATNTSTASAAATSSANSSTTGTTSVSAGTAASSSEASSSWAFITKPSLVALFLSAASPILFSL